MSSPRRVATEFKRLPESDLPDWHAAVEYGHREAWQCLTCNAIFFPQGGEPGDECPACVEVDL